ATIGPAELFVTGRAARAVPPIPSLPQAGHAVRDNSQSAGSSRGQVWSATQYSLARHDGHRTLAAPTIQTTRPAPRVTSSILRCVDLAIANGLTSSTINKR